MRVSVPGNILLLGEYAVLEEGGLGLALAIDRRVRISVDPWNRLLIEGSWIGGAMRWTPEDPSASPLLSAAVEELSLWQRHAGGTKPVLGGRVSIDSSEFYQPDGRKAGFGSSAAVVVGLVCALLASAGHAYAISEGTALRLALSAHRRAQGGRGSGYDVYCSFHGGLGLFHGGKAPAWETCRLQWGHSLVIFPGPSPVSTPDAILEYRSWKENNPDKARSLLEESNRRVLSFVRSRSEREAAGWFRACKDLGIALGDAIGVDARIPVPPDLDPDFCKSLGAGNELGACLLPAGALPPTPRAELLRVTPLEQGIAWEA